MMIYFIAICLITICVISFLFPDKNRMLILDFVIQNKMTEHKDAICTISAFLSQREKLFNVYINENYIIIINSQYNNISFPYQLFSENYIIYINCNDKEVKPDLFLNFIKNPEIEKNSDSITIKGNVFSKTIFNKDFIEKDNIKIAINGLV